MRILLLDDEQAEFVRGPTADGSALDPRRIDLGDYAGQWMLPERVMTDPAHDEHAALFATLPVVDVDPDTLWAPAED